MDRNAVEIKTPLHFAEFETVDTQEQQGKKMRLKEWSEMVLVNH